MDTSEKTILLAQDEEDSLHVFGTILRREGYRVLTADSGEEAIRLAMQEVPELIFTEARLPIVDGWRLIEVLHAEPALGGVQFVLLTAWVDPGQAQRARTAGFVGYIAKPVDPTRLLHEALHLIGPANQPSKEDRGRAARRPPP